MSNDGFSQSWRKLVFAGLLVVGSVGGSVWGGAVLAQDMHSLSLMVSDQPGGNPPLRCRALHEAGFLNMDIAKGQALDITDRIDRPAEPAEAAQMIEMVEQASSGQLGGSVVAIDAPYPKGSFARLAWTHMRGTEFLSGVLDYTPATNAALPAALLASLLGQPCSKQP